ncbi:hypothetical protein Tco_0685251 [Tanacetum coccineum]
MIKLDLEPLAPSQETPGDLTTGDRLSTKVKVFLIPVIGQNNKAIFNSVKALDTIDDASAVEFWVLELVDRTTRIMTKRIDLLSKSFAEEEDLKPCCTFVLFPNAPKSIILFSLKLNMVLSVKVKDDIYQCSVSHLDEDPVKRLRSTYTSWNYNISLESCG